MAVVAALIVFAFTAVAGQDQPLISFISKEKIVSIGDDVELTCRTLHAKDYSVQWLKRGYPTILISRGSSVDIPDARFTVGHTRTEAENSDVYVLRMQRVQEIDVGTYECRIVTGTASHVSARVDVEVKIPPIISDNSTRSVIVAEGEKLVQLHCHARGHPRPLITWRRERNALLPGDVAFHRGGDLTLSNVTKEMRGTYYCVADNGVEPGARRAIGVEIEYRPHVRAARTRYRQSLGQVIDLTCHIEAFPSPSIGWFKKSENEPISDNQFYSISTSVSRDEVTSVTTLHIKAIEKKHFDWYECRATNKLGSNDTVVELVETVNVQCPPACDVPLQYYAASADRVNLFGLLMVVMILVPLH